VLDAGGDRGSLDLGHLREARRVAGRDGRAPLPHPPEPPQLHPPERPGEIGVRALLEEMVDPLRLAKLPDPPYVAHLASSYDRRSISPDDPEGWFANDDWASRENSNYVRVEQTSERTEYVLLDVKGPGMIARIWSATPTGTLRLYVDGAEKLNSSIAGPLGNGIPSTLVFGALTTGEIRCNGLIGEARISKVANSPEPSQCSGH
jgi:hypothetical protein